MHMTQLYEANKDDEWELKKVIINERRVEGAGPCIDLRRPNHESSVISICQTQANTVPETEQIKEPPKTLALICHSLHRGNPDAILALLINVVATVSTNKNILHYYCFSLIFNFSS